MTASWVSALLDLDAGGHAAGLGFWAAVTGYEVSPPRGDLDELVTLLPPDGDDYLRVQRLAEGGPGVHLDLHVVDPQAAADAAVRLGARRVADRGYVVMTSPAGLTYCLVGHPRTARPRPHPWPGGASQVDQVCLDLPPATYDAECGFWTSLTGWAPTATDQPEFRRLLGPPGQPLRLLLQRLDDEQPAAAHLDLAAEDRTAEVDRHLALGAERVRDHAWWTVLRDPAGYAYCITDRRPGATP